MNSQSGDRPHKFRGIDSESLSKDAGDVAKSIEQFRNLLPLQPVCDRRVRSLPFGQPVEIALDLPQANLLILFRFRFTRLSPQFGLS